MSPLPWRPASDGLTVALRVTPRGGRDAIDGIETLSDGRSVLKLRVRAVADGGEANRAVTELLAKAIGVKQVTITGDASRLDQALRDLVAAHKPTGK